VAEGKVSRRPFPPGSTCSASASPRARAREDILKLAETLLTRLHQRQSAAAQDDFGERQARLLSYAWPGKRAVSWRTNWSEPSFFTEGDALDFRATPSAGKPFRSGASGPTGQSRLYFPIEGFSLEEAINR